MSKDEKFHSKVPKNSSSIVLGDIELAGNENDETRGVQF
eukprot:CAMPEP_0114355738 /NCGR_PEP_ID=MMETSP0101-20121206/20449_1 /TAXON_ID=38822 ORGANISM="Pteridomonas danica, Strain PT" /NCGR_SAMPLE_ID=MMETSP0101 /ASSEMBLY_ACC=CAM_ASM_000211 /LENGTH=38 /DNA_ID= /DNA_START= /DNA_END= /DNA_ORIENTATION=